MTPTEISDKAKGLRQSLVVLSRQQLGVGNYKQIMRDYQVLVAHIIELVDELAKDEMAEDAAALAATKPPVDEGKESDNGK